MTPEEDRYVSYREHAALLSRVNVIEAKLSHLPDKVEKLSEKIDALAAKINMPSTQADGVALALHRAIDAFSSAPKSAQSGLQQVVQLIGAIAIGALSYRLFGGAL